MQIPAFTSNDYPGLANYILSNATRSGPLPNTVQVSVSNTALPVGVGISTVAPNLSFYVSVTPPVSPVMGSFWLNANPLSTGYLTINLCVYVTPSPLWHLCTSVQEVMNGTQAITESAAYISQGSGGGAGGNEFQYTPPLTTGMMQFTLPVLPIGPVKLIFNSVVYLEGVDFTRSGVNVTWLQSVLIETEDALTFSYPV